MAAVTTAIAAGVSLAGLGMSASQAIKADKAAKQARGAAERAANDIKNMKQVNQLADLQVPTLGYELAQQGLDKAAMASLQSAQGAGAEGVIGSVGQINQSMNDAELKLAADANEAAYNRDVMVGKEDARLDQERTDRLYALSSDELTGAQNQATAEQMAKQNAINSAIGLGTDALGYLDNEELIALYNKKKGMKIKPSGLSSTPNVAYTPEGLTPVAGGTSVLPNYDFLLNPF